uniref:MRP-L46 domain-containing protein n=1 Tax=Rhabditophanes sp. KR3021 TaxID=114890 RepID=A0AC35UDV4_9BILA
MIGIALKRFSTLPVRHLASGASLHVTPEPRIDVIASLILFREPIVAASMTSIESKYAKVQKEIEDRNSLKSDFELQMEKDEILMAKKAELEAQGKDLSELEGEMGVTAAMKEDEWKKNAMDIRNRYGGESGKENEAGLKSVLRLPQNKLVFVARQKFRGKDDAYLSPWVLPQTDGVTISLRKSAQLLLQELFSGSVTADIYGNAPVAFHKFKYSPKVRERLGKDEANVFFYSAYLKSHPGDIQINEQIIGDYQWLNFKELKETIKPRDYYSSIRPLLVD